MNLKQKHNLNLLKKHGKNNWNKSLMNQTTERLSLQWMNKEEEERHNGASGIQEEKIQYTQEQKKKKTYYIQWINKEQY